MAKPCWSNKQKNHGKFGMSKELPHVITILGPTASGKTEVACHLAALLEGEIISADSRQVYREMDIGTGKDLEEYEVNDEPIPYHLIDIHQPGYKYNIAEFQLDFLKVMPQIVERNNVPILCGGSGLYIESALKGNTYLGIPMNKEREKELSVLSTTELEVLYAKLSSKVRENLNSETRRRMIRAIIVDEYLQQHPDFETVHIPEFKYTIFGIDISREKRRQKITKRLKHRLENGLIEEVEQLLQKHLTDDDLDYYGLEYKWVGMFLKGEINRDELFERLNIAIHKFSKRQMTWFRRMERSGYKIHWIDAELPIEEKVEQIEQIYREK